MPLPLHSHIFSYRYILFKAVIFSHLIWRKKTSVEGYGMRSRLIVRYIDKGFTNHFNGNHYKSCRQWIRCIYVRPQQKVNFWKEVKSVGRVFIMKSWWKELRPKGSLYCAGPHIDHMWLEAPPHPPSQHFFWSKAKIKVISIWSTTPKTQGMAKSWWKLLQERRVTYYGRWSYIGGVAE